MPMEKMEAALAEALSGEGAGSAEAGDALAEAETRAPEDAGDQQDGEAGAGTAADEPPPELPAARAGEQAKRNETGRFTKAAKAAQPPLAKGGKPPGAAAPPAASAPQPSAPRTWSPALREKWGALPREVKDQVLKREGEHSRAMQESAQARERDAQVTRVLQPFIPHLQASGVEPLRHMETLFRTDYALRTGTPAQRAQVFAQAMEAYGVGVEELAGALEGKQPAPPAQQQQFRDPRLDTFFGQLQQARQRRGASVTDEARQQIEAFKEKAEFLEDVREDMADLLSTATRRGRQMSLQEAYDKACQMNEEVRTLLAQRKAEETRRVQSKKAQQAQYAAGSVKSEPAPPSGGRRPTWQEALKAGLQGG